MVSTNTMLDELISNNIEFNEILDANQKGYEVKYIETNNPSQYSSYPGFKILGSDDLFTKVRVFLRTEPLRKSRLDEKPRDTDRSHFVEISYKNGLGGMVINMTKISQAQLNNIVKKIEKIK